MQTLEEDLTTVDHVPGKQEIQWLEELAPTADDQVPAAQSLAHDETAVALSVVDHVPALHKIQNRRKLAPTVLDHEPATQFKQFAELVA